MIAKVSKQNASIDAVLRGGHENTVGKLPVRIRVTFDRKSWYYPVLFNGEPLYLKRKEWDELQGLKVRKAKRPIKEAFETAKSHAIDARDKITSNGHPFSIDRFEVEYLVQESKKGFLKLFDDHLESLRKEDRIGTYKAYNNALQAFKKFRKDKDLSPIDLTPVLLRNFETFMRKERGVNRNTIAIYMRALKVVFNVAISKNPSLAEFYPFATKQTDRIKYKIKSGSGKKGEALTVEELQNFIDSETDPGFPEHEAKLLWLFSFYCQGMNFRDIALLKYSNIKGDSILYVREKTKDTESTEEPIEIPLSDRIREIIVTLGNPDKRPTSYVFGIVDKSMDLEYQDAVIRQKIKITNKWLKRLCKEIGLPGITTYWARHSYANLLKESGESIELIRELLGHSDIRTTEAYLKRFDLNKKRTANEKIEALLKVS